MAVALLLGGAPGAEAQAPQWLFSGSSVDFRNVEVNNPAGPSPKTQTPAPTFTGPTTQRTTDKTYWAAQYDYKGDLLFYIDGRNLKQADGTVFGTLLSPPRDFDCAIVPRPGSCDDYLLICSMVPPGQSGSNVFVYRINASNPSACTLTMGYGSNTGQLSSDRFQYTRLAISPLLPNNTRTVFAIGDVGNLCFAVISNSDITPLTRVDYFYCGLSTTTSRCYRWPAAFMGGVSDMKISPTGARLILVSAGVGSGSGSAQLACFKLSTAPNTSVGLFDFNSPDYGVSVAKVPVLAGVPAFGLEFAPGSTNDPDQVLFSAGSDNGTNSGIRLVKFQYPPWPAASSTVIPPGDALVSPVSVGTRGAGQSQLEKGVDGRVYAINVTGSVHPITYTTTAAAPLYGPSIGSVTPTLAPIAANLPLQRTTGTRAFLNDARGYIPVSGPVSVNVNSGPQTITFKLDNTTNWVGGPTWSLSSNTTVNATIVGANNGFNASILVPQSVVVGGAQKEFTVSLLLNTPCGARIVERKVVVFNEAPCLPPCTNGRPAPVTPTSAYPNPASEMLTVPFTGENASITLTHLLNGKQFKRALTIRQAGINVTEFPTGTYLLEVKSGATIRRERLVISH